VRYTKGGVSRLNYYGLEGFKNLPIRGEGKKEGDQCIGALWNGGKTELWGRGSQSKATLRELGQTENVSRGDPLY